MSYSYSATEILVSAACPGVTVVLARLTDGRRRKIRAGLRANLLRISDLQAEIQLAERTEADAEMLRLAGRAALEISDLRDETVRAYPRELFIRAEGLSLTPPAGDIPIGDAITWTDLEEFGPPDLVAEISLHCAKAAGLTDAERQGFELPTPSSAPADGKTSATNADSAASMSCGEPVAADSSPSPAAS